MYCKHCGLQVAEDSKFCQHCGGRQDTTDKGKPEHTNTSETKVKMEVNGEIKATISPSLPKFNGFRTFINTHSVFVICASIWIILNFILLSAGDDRNGFWPHIYSHSETIWDHDTIEYNPFSESYYTGRVGHQGPKETKIDWDLKYYGLTEFLIYALLIPFVSFFIYSAILEKYKNKTRKPIRFNPSEGLRRF